jgi:hypothetical protein
MLRNHVIFMVFENCVVLYAVSSAFMCQQRAINLNGHYKGYTYYYDETTP